MGSGHSESEICRALLCWLRCRPPNHLDGIPPLLFSLSVCSPSPVLVGLLVGLLVVITVLVIYAQSWGQEEVILGPSETQLVHLPNWE